ncbi:MAG: molybdopterin biosynthesis protein, partial [Candidatus Brockarchaeota archaeon]|nr:molybdopterin biosynthesis protein [Candidatus Brockarchaeota archaeon]
TGAPLPAGADAVVMLEHTTVSADKVKIYRPVAPGENVLRAGADIKAKEVVLKKMQHLGARELGVLAAIGMPAVMVYKKPRVSILSTGGELVKPGKPLEPGKIYDINQSTLVASVIECNCEPIPLGIIPDDPQGMKSTLKNALIVADVVITSGATSAGAEDILPQILNELGKPGVIVWGLATKPGKPTTVAVINGKPVFALPGHPTSALTIFLLLVRPFLLRAAGFQLKQPIITKAHLGAKVFSAAGRTTFIPVKLVSKGEGETIAQPIPSESGAITTLASADGFIVIPSNIQFIEQGEVVEVHLFSPWIR